MTDETKIEAEYLTYARAVNLQINVTKGTVYYNNTKVENANAEELYERLVDIISSWEHVMYNPRIMGGASYRVKKQENKNIDKYEGLNDFPDNFDQFLDLLREVAANAKSI